MSNLESDIAQLNVWAQSFGGKVIDTPQTNTLMFTYDFARPPGEIASFSSSRDEGGVRMLKTYLLRSAQITHTIIPGLWSQGEDLELQRSQREATKFNKLHS